MYLQTIINHGSYKRVWAPLTPALPGRMVEAWKLIGECKVTKKPYTVIVTENELIAFNEGQFIQDAMPRLSPGDREFLLSGFSPEGWEQVFSSFENDDEEEDDEE